MGGRCGKSKQNRKYVEQNDRKYTFIWVYSYPIRKLLELFHHFFKVNYAHDYNNEKNRDAQVLREAPQLRIIPSYNFFLFNFILLVSLQK